MTERLVHTVLMRMPFGWAATWPCRPPEVANTRCVVCG